jgi:hypothetical protein
MIKEALAKLWQKGLSNEGNKQLFGCMRLPVRLFNIGDAFSANVVK